MSEDNSTLNCSRIFSCLYKYTIASIGNRPPKVLKELADPLIILEETEDNKISEWMKKKADCKMKTRVQYHFHDHVFRWINRPDGQRRFPWKLILHLVLVALVTTQVISVLNRK